MRRLFFCRLTCSGFLMALALFSGCTEAPEKRSGAPPTSAQTGMKRADAGPSNTSAPQSGYLATVEIKGMRFNPEELTIHKGDTVVWVNNDLTNHCITEVAKKWTSSAIAAGSLWKKAVTENTDYYCAIHVVMKGKIKVE